MYIYTHLIYTDCLGCDSTRNNDNSHTLNARNTRNSNSNNNNKTYDNNNSSNNINNNNAHLKHITCPVFEIHNSCIIGCAYLSTQGGGASHDGFGVLVSTTFPVIPNSHLLMTCPALLGERSIFLGVSDFILFSV